MNINELKKKFRSIGVNEQAYSLNGESGDEQYCLENNAGRWHYYYSERGQKNNERTFDNESDACNYIYTLVINDPTVKF